MKEIITDLAPYIPLAKPIIDTIFKHKLDSLKSWLIERKTGHQVFDYKLYQSGFEEYLCRTIYKCSQMDTLIFPNRQINIENIYQPLTLVPQTVSDVKNFKIDSFPQEIFENYKKVIVVDSAGMGKSTLSKFIGLHSIKNREHIPVFIELRKINSENQIIDEFLNQLNSIDKIFDKDFVLKLLKMGEFLIILDGYDEINSEDQQIVTENIRNFISKCDNNHFLLTSRPEGSISAFGDFQRMNIEGLKMEEAFSLFKKYDSISRTKISDNLIQELTYAHQQIREFLTNPFLVSLLYKTYSFKRDIPSRKSTFYNEVYTALYQDHDLSKDAYKRDKFSKLDIQDFRLVLREFAIFTSKKGEVEYSETDIIEYIKICKNKLSFISFKETLLLKDLLTTVPLFTKDGAYVKWSHKSIQDYFSAEYITYHPKKDEIINFLIKTNVRKYFNILDLVIELDPNLIRHYVLPQILENLIDHFDNTQSYDDIPEHHQYIRKMLTFHTEFWFNKSKILNTSAGSLKTDEFSRVNEYLKINYDIKFESATMFPNKLFIGYNRSNIAFFVQLLGSKGLLGKTVFDNLEDFSLLNTDSFDTIPRKVDTNDTLAIYNKKFMYNQMNFALLNSSNSDLRLSSFFVPDIKYCKKLLTTLNQEIQENSKEKYLDNF